MAERLSILAGTLAIALVGADPAVRAAEPPAVVASIGPIHSLVAGVMGEIGQPTLLVEGAASPHDYGMKPSDAIHLQAADLVFWIGPNLETFLAKPITMVRSDARVVALAEVDGLTLYPTREGGTWEAHRHEHAEDGEQTHGSAEASDHHDDHARTDLHLWLDPTNAIVMTRAIAAALSAADPGNAPAYQAHAAEQEERLKALDQELEARLGPVRERPFIVFHDAYQYFERRYDLAAAGAITIGPERAPGAKRLQEIHQRLAASDAVCVFSEPQFEPAVIETVVEGTDARTGVLDPLGAGLEPGPGLYPRLLSDLTESLVDCLDPTRS